MSDNINVEDRFAIKRSTDADDLLEVKDNKRIKLDTRKYFC